MVSEYLKSSLNSLSLEPSIEHAIISSTETILSIIKSKLLSNTLAVPIKRKKFKAKLPTPEVSPMPKPKLDKKSREEYFKEHQKKTEESKEFTKKLIEERQERQKKILEREREIRMKTLQEIEEQRKRQEEIEKKMEEDKVKRVHQAQQKSEIRKKQLNEIKEEVSKKIVYSKPLYKQMEDAYKQQVLMPKLEQQKAELAKKRMLFQPLNPEELKEHSRKHEEIRREQEYKRKKELQQKMLEAQVNSVAINLQSRFTQAVLDENRKKKEEEEKAKEEKLLNVHKRLQYSKLVKEMFPPIVGETKKLDVDIKKSLKNKAGTAVSRENSVENLASNKNVSVYDYKSDIGSLPKRK